jgi:hypothetical protein
MEYMIDIFCGVKIKGSPKGGEERGGSNIVQD